ncbi:MAG: ribosome maturation factor RimP [Nitriliruptoraceae bacterium]
MARPSDESLPEVISELAWPIAADLGIEVLDVAVKGQRGSRKVRITADSADLDAEAGVDIDVIAAFSRALGGLLDEHDPIAGGYTLEVTSPGADRPLVRPRDFARNRGREVRIQLAPEGEGELTGELVAVSASTVTLSTRDGDHDVSFDDIVRGHVVLPW